MSLVTCTKFYLIFVSSFFVIKLHLNLGSILKIASVRACVGGRRGGFPLSCHVERKGDGGGVGSLTRDISLFLSRGRCLLDELT